MTPQAPNRRDFLRLGSAAVAFPAWPAGSADTDEIPGLRLVRVEAGRFRMGNREPGTSDDDPPARPVEIARPFLIATAPLTQRTHAWVMGADANPSRFRDDPSLPVESISWFDAVRFCNALSRRVGLEPAFAIDGERVQGRPSDGFRLPLEAEWEYACRAGTDSAYCCGSSPESLKDYAWFGLGSEGSTKPVASKRASAWGLFDVHGNVDEWCWDWYGPPAEASGPRTPAGPVDGVFRVVRGGSFFPGAAGLRASLRGRAVPRTRAATIGLRLVRSLPYD